MKTVERLLAMFIAVTLALSVLSVANPLFFTSGLSAFADEGDEDDNDNDNSGSGSGSDEEEQEGKDDDSDEQDDEEYEEESEEENEDNEHGEEDEEHEEEDDDDKGRPDKDEDEDRLVQALGNNSKVSLKVDDDEVELEVEVEEGDLEDGLYNVTFACSSPEVSQEFAGALEIEDGEGEFETELALADGTYSGCEVNVADLSAAFPPFTVMVEEEEDEEIEEEIEQEAQEEKTEVKLKTEDESIEIEVEIEGVNMTDGMYDVTFSCEEPAFNVTLDDAFEVEDGEGKFKQEIGLANGTYNGCQLAIQDIVVPFDSFTIVGEDEEPDEHEIEESRKERRHTIVNTVTGAEIHQRHLNAQPASTGDYQLGWNYSLTATGIAEGDDDMLATAVVETDLVVWKSNKAVILLDVIGGQVEIGNQTYTIVIGYALYSIQADILRINALVIDDATGDVLKLKMRGSPVAEDAEFPMETGSLELEFEGNSGPSKNELDRWELMLEGTVAAV